VSRRTAATKTLGDPHRFVHDPDLPGVCGRCQRADDPASPRNDRHDPAAIATHEAQLRAATTAHDRRYNPEED
jgi:hypothetical protein